MLLFIDESGHDHGHSPYEVLCGVSITESKLWKCIQAIQDAQRDHFGLLLKDVDVEFKGKRLLKTKTFKQANSGRWIPDRNERRDLARSCLEKGFAQKSDPTQPSATSQELAAYRQAILDFVPDVFRIAARYDLKLFAAMVEPDAKRSKRTFLRRDYAFLFERYFYYLEDISSPPHSEMGLIVFDELEKSQSRILINQMEQYFLETNTGYSRSSKIVPEPFFVHSDLTTLVQIADIAAYSLNWAYRFNDRMNHKIRPELKTIAEQIAALRYRGARPDADHPSKSWNIHGIFHLDDLRPSRERS